MRGLGPDPRGMAMHEWGWLGEQKAGVGLDSWHCFLSKENNFNQLQKYLRSICSSLLTPICPDSLLSREG